MWDEDFERLVRRQVPFLSPDEPLAADADLQEHGLDSMGMVELLVTLEDHYDVRLSGDALSAETFATPSVLWRALTAVRVPSAPA